MNAKIQSEQKKYEEYLQGRGLRLTKGRKYVFDEVMEAHGHFAPEELVKQCADSPKVSVSRATIYRSLQELREAGIVRETAFGEKHTHFEHCYDEKPHHHARCIRCGTYIEFPDLAEACFIQMGDFLSYALDTAVAQNMQCVIIGGMVGKLTKMAQGETITHAGRNAVDTDLLAQLAKQAGADDAVCQEIAAAETARFAAEKMEQLGLSDSFHHLLAQKVVDTLSSRYLDKFVIKVLVCDFDGNKIAQAEGNRYVA